MKFYVLSLGAQVTVDGVPMAVASIRVRIDVVRFVVVFRSRSDGFISSLSRIGGGIFSFGISCVAILVGKDQLERSRSVLERWNQ